MLEGGGGECSDFRIEFMLSFLPAGSRRIYFFVVYLFCKNIMDVLICRIIFRLFVCLFVSYTNVPIDRSIQIYMLSFESQKDEIWRNYNKCASV